MTEFRIVFEGGPGVDGCQFLRVEDASGKDINLQHWQGRADGLWELRVTTAATPSKKEAAYKADADDLFIKLQAALSAARTPGTVEVCERVSLYECADYAGRHTRPTDCKVYACPLHPPGEKEAGR